MPKKYLQIRAMMDVQALLDLYVRVCMIQVALAVMSMERTADWAKERGP